MPLLSLCVLLVAACQVHIQTAPPQPPASIPMTMTLDAAPTVEPTATEPPPNVAPTAMPAGATATPASRPVLTASTPPTATARPRMAAQTPPDRITAPSINLDAAVQVMTWEMIRQGGELVSQWVVPDGAAGWHVNSARPGQPGNTVLSGHHNIRGEVFRYLVDLEPGAGVTLVADGRAYAYRVESKFIVPERDASAEQQAQNASWIAPTIDDRLTLVTCWPYTGNTHRVIVVAKPLD